jgi:hypothetical protein
MKVTSATTIQQKEKKHEKGIIAQFGVKEERTNLTKKNTKNEKLADHHIIKPPLLLLPPSPPSSPPTFPR